MAATKRKKITNISQKYIKKKHHKEKLRITHYALRIIFVPLHFKND